MTYEYVRNSMLRRLVYKTTRSVSTELENYIFTSFDNNFLLFYILLLNSKNHQ